MLNKSFSSVFLLLCSLFCLTSCGQNKYDVNIRSLLQEKIDTYINSILKDIKHPTEELVYFVEPFFTYSYYEIKVNDIIVRQKYYTNNNPYENFTSINNALNSKGKQKLSFIAYPSKETTFQSNDNIDIDISTIDKFRNTETIYSYEAPINEDELSEFIGLESYKSSFEFEAKLPYKKVIDWSDSENLKEQKNIEKEVLEAYKEIMNLYADIDNLLKLYKPIFQDEAQSVYATAEKKSRLLYELNLKRMYPFFYKSIPTLDNNYELKFYANGKLVTLEKKKENPLSYSKSALSIVYNKDLDKFPETFHIEEEEYLVADKGLVPQKQMEIYIMFHKPKGSNKLELATDVFREEILLNGVE